MPEKHCSYAALEGKYVLHKTLGTGGFAKVKLATHVLTNEKVAIKIMNKAALGDDLPRVQLEIEALRVLNHPNICKLYQVMETEKNYFIVLEENLLLDNEQNLKLIDFGLCAKPKTGMQQQLETCCGSPAYAAPELITGDNYNGNKVDIWSMGVLLYALLCGFLPFDDENVTKLYKKIQKGRYFCPSWLSSESKALLSQMLQVDPAKRISIEELMSHSWITEGLETTDWNTYKEVEEFDPDCLAELAVYYRRPMRSIEISLNQCKFDYLSATYELLLSKKIAGKSFSLMKQQSVLKDSKFRENTSRTFDTSPVLKTVSMDSLTDSDLLVLGSPQNMSKTSIYSSKAASPSIISKDKDDKENFILPLAPSTKKNKKSTTSMNKNKLISNENYCIGSPKSLVFSASLDTAVNEIGEASSNVISLYTCDKRAKSFESPSFNAMTPKRRPPRQIGSSAKKFLAALKKV